MQQHPNQPGGFRSHRSPDIHRYPRSGLRCPQDLWFFSNTNGPTTDWAFQYSTIQIIIDLMFLYFLTLWLNYQKFTDLKIACGHWNAIGMMPRILTIILPVTTRGQPLLHPGYSNPPQRTWHSWSPRCLGSQPQFMGLTSWGFNNDSTSNNQFNHSGRCLGALLSTSI